jgi:hypothetical protein
VGVSIDASWHQMQIILIGFIVYMLALSAFFQYGLGYSAARPISGRPSTLSSIPGNACTSCHSTDQFFTDPD